VQPPNARRKIELFVVDWYHDFDNGRTGVLCTWGVGRPLNHRRHAMTIAGGHATNLYAACCGYWRKLSVC
jgi:hypothetical protein